jgi:Delta3-Delta2-enoyl-CoA isomerase
MVINRYPIPIIALVNGHTFGAGVFLAFAHDYRIQNPSRGFICLPEIELGLLIPTPLQVMFQKKLTPTTYRDAVLEGRRFGGPDALKDGLVDALGGLEQAIKFVQEKKLVGKGGLGTVWGGLKEDAWRDVLISIENDGENSVWRERVEMRNSERKEDGRRMVEEWELVAGKAKI